MGKDLAESEPAARAIFDSAEDLLGYPLSELCWSGPQEVLNDTLHTQPALLTHSIAVLHVLHQRFPGIQARFVAGHSLGEYSALAAADVLDFRDTLALVRERGRAMKEAGDRYPGGMAAVLGLDLEEVVRGCRAASEGGEGSVWVANDNCPGQIVVSGDERALKRAEKTLSDAGARRVVRLAVSIAAHSPLMAPALEAYNHALDGAAFQSPTIPIIGNVHAKRLTTAEEVRTDLRAQLISRVRWTETIERMLREGVNTFLEIGSGSVLIGLLRRIDRSAKGIALDEPSSFDQLAR